jgi:hypothetical protein
VTRGRAGAGGRRLALALALLALTTAGCGGGSPAPDRPAAPAAHPRADPSVERALQDPAVARRLDRCPVTAPNHSVPPGESPPPGQPPTRYYGRGGLWTVVPARGVVVGDQEPDGALSMKFPWWRGVRGRLTITGRRLDGRAAPLRAHIPRGYGPIGFQATALVFPAPGCWEVTGRAGSARMTFVALVVRARPQ